MIKKFSVIFLGFVFFQTHAFATESIANSLGVYPSCDGCHTNANLNSADKGNLKSAAKTAYNKDKRGLSGLKTLLDSTPSVITCIAPRVLINNVCSIVSTINTKPSVNAIAQQWDVQVGETLIIPISVNDAQEDDFQIIASKLTGSSLSDHYVGESGLPSVDFKWTPAAVDVNKIKTITFNAKESNTKQKYVSNKISVKIRVWPEGDRDFASITKLKVTKTVWKDGMLNLVGAITFNKLLTNTERQDFIDKSPYLSLYNLSGVEIYSMPLAVKFNGNWQISAKIPFVPCDITLQFSGQNASRKVIGCGH